MSRYATDAVIVGAGPNGLGAALALARTGRSVLILDRAGAWTRACARAT